MKQFSDTYDRGMVFGQRNTDALLFLYEESGNIGLLPCTFALIITTNNANQELKIASDSCFKSL